MPSWELKPEDIDAITYTPNDAVNSALKIIDGMRAETDPGVMTGIPNIDEYIFPGRPGHLIAVLGRTSNYKSGFMQWWARQQANYIRDNGAEDQCIIYVTWEQAVEEMICFDLAYSARLNSRDVMLGKINDDEMKRLRLVHGPKRAVTPVYLIGHSVQDGKSRPILSLSAVRDGLLMLKEEYGIRPRVIYLDYLQRMAGEKGREREQQVSHNVDAAKDLAFEMRCLVVTGTQANRRSYEKAWGIPDIIESQWTSNLEQTCDGIWGVWYPCKSVELGTEIEKSSKVMVVDKNLLILQIIKQRWGDSGNWWQLKVEPEINEISPPDVEYHRQSLNDYAA